MTSVEAMNWLAETLRRYDVNLCVRGGQYHIMLDDEFHYSGDSLADTIERALSQHPLL